MFDCVLLQLSLFNSEIVDIFELLIFDFFDLYAFF